MSRRTEMAYKAQFPGKSAQHDEAQGSGDRVNAAVGLSRKGLWRLSRTLATTGRHDESVVEEAGAKLH